MQPWPGEYWNEDPFHVSNYMVKGFKRERTELGERPMQLASGIEGVSRGIVVVDREVDPHYLAYLEQNGLYTPDTRLEVVDGNEATMVGRLLASGRADQLRAEVALARLRFIDTFGHSEIVHRSSMVREYLDLEIRLGIPLLYAPGVAALIMYKSEYREAIQRWIDEEPDIASILEIPKGLTYLYRGASDVERVRQFLNECESSQVVIKKDVATFNQGNTVCSLEALRALLDSPQEFDQFLETQCRIEEGGTFCMEEYVEHEKTPSSYIKVLPSGDVIIKSIQEQLYEDGRLLGFKYPCDQDPETMAKLKAASLFLGRKLYELGYRGHAVPDFCIPTAPGKQRLVLMEINMRRGGSSLGQMTAARLHGERLNDVSYVTSMVRFAVGTGIQQIREALDTTAYDRSRNEGIVLVEGIRLPQTGLGTLVAMRRPGESDVKELLAAGRRNLQPLLHTA